MAGKSTGRTTTETGAKRGRGTKPKVEKLRPEPSRGEAAVREEPQEKSAITEVSTMTLTHDQIANRARDIWERRGRPQGQDDRIWHEAEDELRREMQR